MPKGVYIKSRNYRKTNKLTEALTALKSSDPYFQVAEHMSNDDIFDKLKEFGFVYSEGKWRLGYRAKSSKNGSTLPVVRKEVHFDPVTITPIAADRLEMCIGEGQLDTLQNVIEAMHVLGFKVEVKIVGIK